MFSRLFAESGLSLDRLKSLLEVAAAGSIVKAANGEPVRQSQYSRQIKELEDFFHTRLMEREGKGIRLTSNGRELARISRFFMLGLSHFQRGCLAEEQVFRIGASATFTRQFLLPLLSRLSLNQHGNAYVSETGGTQEIERRLHDLTLHFGVVTKAALSRPLQTKLLGQWHVELWVPKELRLSPSKAARAFEEQRLPLALAKEFAELDLFPKTKSEASLVCDSFVDARAALDGRELAALLPSFLAPAKTSKSFLRVPIPRIDSQTFQFHLAWNPRLLRLNPHASRKRDWLAGALTNVPYGAASR